MAYIRYKAVTRDFNFSNSIELENIPTYGKDYVYDNETILAAYKVGRDISIITDKKIMLFDNSIKLKNKKEVTTVPYTAVTAHSIMFHSNSSEIYLLLSTGNPLLLKFVNMDETDKYKLRLLYNAMSSCICSGKVPNDILKKLTTENFER